MPTDFTGAPSAGVIAVAAMLQGGAYAAEASGHPHRLRRRTIRSMIPEAQGCSKRIRKDGIGMSGGHQSCAPHKAAPSSSSRASIRSARRGSAALVRRITGQSVKSDYVIFAPMDGFGDAMGIRRSPTPHPRRALKGKARRGDRGNDPHICCARAARNAASAKMTLTPRPARRRPRMSRTPARPR